MINRAFAYIFSRLKLINFVTITTLTFAAYGEYAPNLLLNSDIDQLIYRLSARYEQEIPENQFFQPLNYQFVETFLRRADSLQGKNFTSAERHLVNSFYHQTDPHRGRMKWESSKRDLNIKLHLRLLGDIKSSIENDAAVGLKGIFSPLLCGNLGKFSFYAGIDVWTEYNSDTLFNISTYQPYDGIPYNLYGERNTTESHIRSSDIPRGGFRYDGGPIQLEMAIDYLKIGPSVFYPVTLSGTAPPINYVKGTMDLGVIHYTHIAGLLKAQKDKLKYIYAHRLGISFWKNRVYAGINEVIVTGSSISEPHRNDTDKVVLQQQREWELAYLIPLIPFKFVEHYVGDRDNAALSFDLNVLWPINFRWYVEFFLDDILSPSKIFSDDWGNKWAATLGCQYFGVIFNRDLTVTAEYSRVEPWVYTHFYGGSHRYTHFDRCLGSPLGPNSQAVVLEMQAQVHKYHQVGFGIQSIAKNSEVRGGELTDVFQQGNNVKEGQFADNTKKRFLGPGTVWRLQPSLSWNYNPFGLFSVRARYQIDFIDDVATSSISIFGGFAF